MKNIEPLGYKIENAIDYGKKLVDAKAKTIQIRNEIEKHYPSLKENIQEIMNNILDYKDNKMEKGEGIEHTFEISKIKEIVERNINLSNYKIQQENDKVLLLVNKRKDISIDFRLDLMPNEIWFGGFAKLEVSSVSLADPKLNYQNTSARRVVHKKINVRKAVSSYLALEKLLKNFLTKVGELNKMEKGGEVNYMTGLNKD